MAWLRHEAHGKNDLGSTCRSSCFPQRPWPSCGEVTCVLGLYRELPVGLQCDTPMLPLLPSGRPEQCFPVLREEHVTRNQRGIAYHAWHEDPD